MFGTCISRVRRSKRAAARKILDGDHMAAGDELLQIVDQMAAAGTPAEVSVSSTSPFHERLLQLARSPRLSRMHQTFITETRMCIHALDESYAKSEVRDTEHRSLANAIRSGDRELTDRLLTAHMDDAIRSAHRRDRGHWSGARRHVA